MAMPGTPPWLQQKQDYYKSMGVESGVKSAYNPTGGQITFDPSGTAIFGPATQVGGVDKYKQIVGDGYTGPRGGQNFVNGQLFAAEGLNQGDASNPLGAGFGNWLARHGSTLGGTAATYQVPQANMGAALPTPSATAPTAGGPMLKGGGVATLPGQVVNKPGASVGYKPGIGTKPAGDVSAIGIYKPELEPGGKPLTGFKPVMPASGPMSGTPPWMAAGNFSQINAGKPNTQSVGSMDGFKPAANPGLAAYANSGLDANSPTFAQNAVKPVGMAPLSGIGGAPTAGAPGNTNMLGFADMSGLPAIDTDFTGQAQAGADAAYRGATQFMDEDFTRDTDALESRLINQGFTRGTEAFNNEMGRLTRGQMAARQSAAFQAQGVGHGQAGDLLQRALAARAALGGERERGAERDMSRYGIDTQAELSRRGLGLSEDNMSFQQLLQLIASSRGGVNMPNFGSPAPLDVGGAYGIAGTNANNAANRAAYDRNGLYQLGGAALSGIDWGSLFG